MLQEQRAYLQSKISTLRRETRELCSQISQKQRKQSDFRNDINNHLSSVANQKQHLSMRAEGLEMEQRQLQALDAQHKQEERFLRPRLDEAVADHAATEARIQVLMDRLVVLLSSANSASSTMTSQILEEFQGSILNLDEKIQTGKARLESARRENHDFAIRLSDEQAETKTLHDKLCSLQSRLYQGRYFAAKRAEAGDLLAESPSRAAQTVDDKSCSPGRCRRCEHTETPAVSSTNGESNWSCGATQKTPAPTTENGLSDRRAVEAMEETLREVLAPHVRWDCTSAARSKCIDVARWLRGMASLGGLP
jgi:chromosome segregation ATPase